MSLRSDIAPPGGTILLTGASGFVGRQILRALLATGRPIRAVVREGGGDALRKWAGGLSARSQGSDEPPGAAPVGDPASIWRGEKLEAVVSHTAGHLEVRETPDLFSEPADRLSELLAGVETVVHAAWYAEPGEYLVSPRNLDCLLGTLSLARAFAEAGGHRFVGVGTCFEYDLTAGYLPVTAPLAPVTPYAASKAAAFLALTPHFARAGVEFAWCRLFYLHGEGEKAGRLVPYLRERLAAGAPAELTSGSQVRDYLDVREAGARITEVALGREIGPVNICSGAPVTVREIAEGIADEYGARELLRWGARPDNLTDPPVVVGIPGRGAASTFASGATPRPLVVP